MKPGGNLNKAPLAGLEQDEAARMQLHSGGTKQVINHTVEHGHRKQTAGSKMSRAGSNRMETSTLPSPWQHQSDTGRQSRGMEDTGNGMRRECRTGDGRLKLPLQADWKLNILTVSLM